MRLLGILNTIAVRFSSRSGAPFLRPGLSGPALTRRT